MSPRGWATGMSRKSFLDKHGPEYQKAVESGSKSTFFIKLCHNYFEQYHWSLPDNVEPVEGATYEEPTTQDGIKEKGSRIKAKKEGIIWWYGLHWSATRHSGNTLVTPTLGPATIWWGGKYSKALLPKPRIKRLEQVYSSLYYETKIQPEHEEALAVWDEAQKVPETVEQLQKGINNMIPFITEFMHDLRMLTGMLCSVIVRGPSLATEGELTVTHLHEGKTIGDQPLDFGSHAHNLFLSSIIPSYVEFLKLVYPRNKELIKELGLEEPLIPSPMDKGKKKADHSHKRRAADVPEGSTCPNTRAQQIANSTAFPTIPLTPVAPVQDDTSVGPLASSAAC
ncbi:hypothetical protein BS47DRAFT_1361988 [Hydnum rufescens UP504]|uniref:Uncharacterized protein n=1 Tax=Hydnum rufescens UP504 TaxID=1448309 RepID=A0A9P6AY54_9AGAM|nr:hypothetical protein BS47DRAFT_1361988 [Hydnum rufescens UP504]